MSGVPDIVELSDKEDDCILESVTYVNQKCLDKNNYDKANPLLTEFIEKCYNLENSEGMSNVINKMLLKYYNKTNKAFKSSSDFEKVLKRSIVMLDTDPKKRFSHIKELCDILIASSVRRRIKPKTLSTNLEDKYPKIVGKNTSHNDCQLSKDYFIDLDLPEENQQKNDDIQNGNSIIHSEKKNKSIHNGSGSEDDNNLLVPQRVSEISGIRDPLDIEKVKEIEKEIARYKTVIAKLDEQEVSDDSVNSPYIKSERLKAKIVLLYEQLCNLTGNQPVKKRKINLRVIEGHPEGPVHLLETFLNNNIGPDGDPPFPDFSDVVECVREAINKDNIGWTKHQMLQEARSLFTQCGRALQRRRQNRDWQDLLHRVQLERCDDDPADSDPALLKRLEKNKRVAVKKESEILERYSMMQTIPHTRVAVPSQVHSEISDKTEDQRLDETMLEEMNLSNTNISHSLSQDNDSQTKASVTEDKHIEVPNEVNEVKIKKEPEEEIEERLAELGDNYTLTVVEIIEDPFLIIEISDSSDDEGS